MMFSSLTWKSIKVNRLLKSQDKYCGLFKVYEERKTKVLFLLGYNLFKKRFSPANERKEKIPEILDSYAVKISVCFFKAELLFWSEMSLFID